MRLSFNIFIEFIFLKKKNTILFEINFDKILKQLQSLILIFKVCE